MDALAGCGKTYTVKTIMSYMHENDLECLPVAFTGIAASLLHGGCTFHNAFKLPIQINEATVSGVQAHSAHTNYLQGVNLIIMDEPSMTPKLILTVMD